MSETNESDNLQLWKTIRFFMFIAGILLALWLVFVRPVQVGIDKAGKQVDKVLEALTGYKTKVVAGKSVLESREEVMELAMIELNMNTVRSLENESFIAKYVSLGTKRLELQGHFKVKVGYNLAKGCEIQETSHEGRVLVKFPKPQVLSVELIDLRTLREEDGWLNKVNSEDRDSLVNELREQMKKEAEKSGLLDFSESQLRTRLMDLLGVQRDKLEFEAL